MEHRRILKMCTTITKRGEGAVAVKEQRTNAEKARRRVEQELTECWNRGTTIAFADGSSERQDVIGYVGGWGIYVIDQQGIVQRETGDALPASEPRQTNNAAETYAGEKAIMAVD